MEKECECYEEEVQPYRKTDYKSIIYISGCSALLLFWSHPIFLTFSFHMPHSFKMCITFIIIKVNIFPLSPNLGHNITSFYRMYTQIGAVHNE